MRQSYPQAMPQLKMRPIVRLDPSRRTPIPVQPAASFPVIAVLSRDAHRQRADAVDEIGVHALRWTHHLDYRVTLHNLFPE